MKRVWQVPRFCKYTQRQKSCILGTPAEPFFFLTDLPQRVDTYRKKSVAIASRRLECTHTEACEKCSKQGKGFFRYTTNKKDGEKAEIITGDGEDLFYVSFSSEGKKS